MDANHPAPERPSLNTMSVDERLALLEKLEQREAGAVRKTARRAWLSVAIAALLLGLLVFGASWQLQRMRDEVTALSEQRAALQKDIETSRATLAAVEQERKQKQAALSSLIGAVRRTDDRARSGVVTALDADPRSAVLVPRAYVHIVDEGDRQWARNLSDRLQVAGVIPVGIDFVARAAGLKQFQVRYYKKAEEAGAQRIASAMRDLGVPTEPVYLNLENNTRVRQNHFEIWCPDDARRFKLPPLPPPAP